MPLKELLLVVGAQGLITVVSNSVSESEEYPEEKQRFSFFNSNRQCYVDYDDEFV